MRVYKIKEEKSKLYNLAWTVLLVFCWIYIIVLNFCAFVCCGVEWFWDFDPMAAVADMPGDAAAANNTNNNKNNNLETKKSESEFTVQKLVDMFTKLNPLAKEFFPSYYHQHTDHHFSIINNNFADNNKQSAIDNFNNNRRVVHSYWSCSFSWHCSCQKLCPFCLFLSSSFIIWWWVLLNFCLCSLDCVIFFFWVFLGKNGVLGCPGYFISLLVCDQHENPCVILFYFSCAIVDLDFIEFFFLSFDFYYAINYVPFIGKFLGSIVLRVWLIWFDSCI